MLPSLEAIYRYPVKGLSGEALAEAELRPHSALQHDRRFALAHGASSIDPAAPLWLPKSNFLNLSNTTKLACVQSQFDEETGVLTLMRNRRQVARGEVGNPAGCAVIEQFFAAFLGDEMRGAPRLVDAATARHARAAPASIGTAALDTRAGESGEAPVVTFSDVAQPMLSIINLASVRDLERVAGRAVEPLRFRGNLYIDGASAWQELDWVERTIAVGDARLSITGRIDRCTATNVDPHSGMRDMNIPQTLRRGFGHMHIGVYAVVVAGATVTTGASISPDQ